jgi:chemotaxis protein MotB
MLGAAALAGLLGGCNQEQQLREENISLQTRVRMVEAEKADLEQQKTALETENASLRTQLATALAKAGQPALPPRPPESTAKANFGEGLEVSETPTSVTVTLPDAVLFDSGQAVLKAQSKGTLDRVAAVLKKDYAGRMIRVVGHTDTDPIKKSEWKDNWELSVERSLAVVRYLVSKGVETKLVEPAGRGEFDPRAKNDTAAGKAKNRRVQIIITK